MSSRHRHQFTTFMTDPKRSANEEIILYRGISRLLSRICIMCSQGAPWRRTLRCTGSCPSSTAQSNPTPCNQSNGSTQGIAMRESTRAPAPPPPRAHGVCWEGKSGRQEGHACARCTKTRTQREREKGRERNREILRSLLHNRYRKILLRCSPNEVQTYPPSE